MCNNCNFLILEILQFTITTAASLLIYCLCYKFRTFSCCLCSFAKEHLHRSNCSKDLQLFSSAPWRVLPILTWLLCSLQFYIICSIQHETADRHSMPLATIENRLGYLRAIHFWWVECFYWWRTKLGKWVAGCGKKKFLIDLQLFKMVKVNIEIVPTCLFLLFIPAIKTSYLSALSVLWGTVLLISEWIKLHKLHLQ